MFPIVCLGVDAVQMAHTGGKVPFRSFDEEVIVTAVPPFLSTEWVLANFSASLADARRLYRDHLADRRVMNPKYLCYLFECVAMRAIGVTDQAVTLLLRNFRFR